MRSASPLLLLAVAIALAAPPTTADAQTISSAANQVFHEGDPVTPNSAITVTDTDPPVIKAATDLRIRIPAGFGMTWDATDTTVTLGGTAAGNVSTTPSYEDGDRTLVLTVLTDFLLNDDLTVSDLGFTTFSATPADSLELEVNNDGNVTATDDKTIEILGPDVDLAVTKTVDDAAPNEGGTVVYTIALTNNGPDDATGVELTDLLPAGVTFVSSAETQGTYVDGTGVWTVGTVLNAASDTLAITATVDAATAGTTIVNTASVTASDQPDTLSANDSDTADITVQSADLAVTKTVDDPSPAEGGAVVYAIALLNNGPDDATGVELTDLLPAGVTFVSSAQTQGTYVDSTGIWTVGTIAAAAADTLAITATVDPGTAESMILNTATVTASDIVDPVGANDSDDAAITVQPIVPDSVVLTALSLPRIHRSDSLQVRVELLLAGARVLDAATPFMTSSLQSLGTFGAAVVQPDSSYLLAFTADSVSGVNLGTLEVFDPEATIVPRDSLAVEITDRAIITQVLDVGNDQGRQVRVLFQSDLHDAAGEPQPIVDYVVWRRVDDLAATASRHEGVAESATNRIVTSTGEGRRLLGAKPGLVARDGGGTLRLEQAGVLWEPVGPVVPAVRWDEYASVVPTLVDSTDAGIAYSVFFVSAHTASPQVFYNSAVDSGYSVDNLAPAIPANLQLAGSTLVWDDPADTDFNYFSVYGSPTTDLGDAALINYTIAPTLDVAGTSHAYYLVTATDFSGNESGAASAQGGAVSVGTNTLPTSYRLHGGRPSPFRARTMVHFDLPRSGSVSLRVYSVTGRLVRTLIDGPQPAGQAQALWDGRDSAGRLVAPGVYFTRLEAGEYRASRAVVLLR
jgi:uncharacterized repeat protein (TIGR01451 family)